MFIDKILGRINPPTRSKINFISALAWLVAMAGKFGYIPAEQVQVINDAIIIGLPPIIIMLRSFFTNKPV